MIRWFAKNDIATNLIMIGILFVGFFVALPSMPVEINPSYTYKQVSVRFKIKGMSPEEIERKIVIPAENKIKGVNGIKSVQSYIRYSGVFMRVRAHESANLQDLKSDVESRLGRMTSLPAESEKPTVSIPETTRWHEVISVMVSGNLKKEDLTEVGRTVRDELMSQPGISQASLTGGAKRKIYIEPKIESLRSYNLTLSDISKAVRDNSIELTAGQIGSSQSGMQVIAKNQAVTVDDFKTIPVKNDNGAIVTIGDVAEIKDGEDEERMIFMFNGERCMRVEVMRLKHESALTISKKVSDYVEKAQGRFPPGVTLTTWEDNSVSLQSRIDTLKENLLVGAILVLVVLALFLKPSLALFVVCGVPISFSGALILMYLMGVSINLWTLFGFIIVLGIVVDDAIVTAENVHQKLKLGGDRLNAVVQGTKEVATPVTFGVLTTIVAFLPLLFFSNRMGNITKQIPYVIIPVLIFSLIESKFILPGHLKHNLDFFKSANPFPIIHKQVNRLTNALIHYLYQPLLKVCIMFRYAVVLGFVAVMFITYSYLNSDHFKSDKLPTVDSYQIEADLQMIEGTPLEETQNKVLQLVQSVDKLRQQFPDGNTGKSLVGNVFHSAGDGRWGSQDPTLGSLVVEITPPSLRDPDTSNENMISNDEIAQAWHKIIGPQENVKQFKVEGSKAQSRLLRDKPAIEIEFRGLDEKLKSDFTAEAEAWIKMQEWASYASSNKTGKARQLIFKVNENGLNLGLTDTSLARQVRSYVYGETAQRFQSGEDEVQVNVRLADEIRESPHSLNKIRIKTKNGDASLKSVASLQEAISLPSIKRRDGSRYKEIRAGFIPSEKSSSEVHIKSLENKLDEMAVNYPGVSWKFIGEIAENRETEKTMFLAMIGLLFVLYLLLAIPFKSLIQPIFVLLAVPLGIVGALLGHYIEDTTVSYLSILGVLALTGVVVNDSLVLVDYINKKRLEGKSVREAIRMAGVRRFRPILLTSLTTFAGLYPIINETSIEAQFLIPMAISLGWGILFATAITLILIPCAYMVSEDIKAYLYFSITGKKMNPHKKLAQQDTSAPPLPLKDSSKY